MAKSVYLLVAFCLHLVNGMYANPRFSLFKSEVCHSDFELMNDDCRTSLKCTKSGKKGVLFGCHRGLQFSSVDSGCISPVKQECSQRVNERTQTCSRLQAPSIADSKFCHQYYDCTDPSVHKECTFPKLYSTTTHSCEDFSKVTCGKRIEFKSKCQYSSNFDLSTSFTTCDRIYPSCDGLPDGSHPHVIRTNSPWYMVCSGGRLVKEVYCNNNTIPSNDCGKYIWCVAGRKYVMNCPIGTVYDLAQRYCRHKYDVCKPCGTKAC